MNDVAVSPDREAIENVESGVRVPAVPLITHTPYFSVWSAADRLTDRWSTHWTGAIQAMSGLLRIDGKTFRFMGPDPKDVPAMTQIGLQVHPTRTIYRFAAAGVELEAEFLSPLLADDLAILARPVTYLTLSVKTTDGTAHEIEAYVDATGEFAVNEPHQAITASRFLLRGTSVLALRSLDQPVLKKVGDNLRIDWGTFYVAVPGHCQTGIVDADASRIAFAGGEGFGDDVMRFPRSVQDGWTALATRISFGSVDGSASRYLMFAYDEEQALEYFGRPLPPLWKADGTDITTLLHQAKDEYSALRERCATFDARVEADLTARGGEDYARLGALAYRQCLAAHGIAEDLDGTLLMMSKENFSNGCICTVDVTYPGAPFFLYFNPKLLRAQIEPILAYAASPRWRFPFAPHDLGTYPKANGQVYGGGERTEDDQMPVEECGNMLILAGALGDLELANKYWGTLTLWADYLLEKGLDPENQLCTDDFAGHLAHNANLSMKAIQGLGVFAQLAESLGHSGAKYHEAAEAMASEWQKMATEEDHTRLAFDQANTWSQKYNLVWDRLLGVNLFPASLAESEIAFYLGKQNEFGLPLDSRRTYTKLDWIVWTATLATRREDFEAFIRPLVHFTENAPNRVPLTDWYDTVSGRQEGFQARSVVGGVYLPMLPAK